MVSLQKPLSTLKKNGVNYDSAIQFGCGQHFQNLLLSIPTTHFHIPASGLCEGLCSATYCFGHCETNSWGWRSEHTGHRYYLSNDKWEVKALGSMAWRCWRWMPALGHPWSEQTMKQERKAGGLPQTLFIDLNPSREYCDLISILRRSFWLQWRSVFCYKLPVTRSETVSCEEV